MVIEAGKWYLRDNANCNMSKGATLNQLCADNEILALKSSDVAHAMTGRAEADTYATFSKPEGQATSGGLEISGYKDADGSNFSALHLRGNLGEAANTTHSASGQGIVVVRTSVTNGSTGLQAPASCANLFSVCSHTDTRFIVDQEGDLFADGSATSVYDAYCDAQLTRAFSQVTAASGGSGLIDNHWDDFITYNECTLIELDLLGGPRIGVDPHEKGLINYTGMVRLHSGAIWQLHSKLNDQTEEIAALKGQLKALGGCP